MAPAQSPRRVDAAEIDTLLAGGLGDLARHPDRLRTLLERVALTVREDHSTIRGLHRDIATITGTTAHLDPMSRAVAALSRCSYDEQRQVADELLGTQLWAARQATVAAHQARLAADAARKAALAGLVTHETSAPPEEPETPETPGGFRVEPSDALAGALFTEDVAADAPDAGQ